MKYPKIQTLFNRDEKFKVDTSSLRMPEFGLIKRWLITEKIRGVNTRVILHPDGRVQFAGREDSAQIHVDLLNVLLDTFTVEKMMSAFAVKDNPYPAVPTILYGEGYGPKIQKGGGNYRSDPSFRLFDVRVGEWWLNWADVEDVAGKLGIKTVPVIGERDYLPTYWNDLVGLAGYSRVAHEENNCGSIQAEGIVARTEPLLCRRNGERLMWKLKFKDFV